MGFKLVVCPPTKETHYAKPPDLSRLRAAVPGAEVYPAQTRGELLEAIEDADAALGYVPPEALQRAKRLRWVACPVAGPAAGFYHQTLVESDVVVTNVRGIYSDQISVHIMAFVLAFARGLQFHIPRQHEGVWRREYRTVDLPSATAVIVGVGGIGAETAKLCAAFGMTVIGVDPRCEEAPPGVAELVRPSALRDVLGRADFVIVTVPETPETQRMFAAPLFRLMKKSAFFINIGRGATVVLDDLVAALRNAQIAGAGLDVFEVEPLPPHHPLWSTPGVLLTPHVAGVGPQFDNRRVELLIENCRRFNAGEPLVNVVDKAHWF